MDTKKSTMATPTLETFADQTQVFASAWSLINRQFGGEDSLELAEVERGILLDMARRLIEDHDAARQEIASLKAQHEGGKSEALADLAYAHGMTTGWNLCIADKHDEFARIRSMRSSQAISTIEAPQPAAQPTIVQMKDYCKQASAMMARDLTRFDAACEVMGYLKEMRAPGYYMHRMNIVLHGNVEGTDAARASDKAAQPAALAQEDAGGWMRDGGMLYRLTDERRPTNFDEIRVTMAGGSRDIDQTSSRAERLLDMLSSQAQPVTWPRNAAEVREFMDAHCQREERANDDSSPNDDDLYALTAHDFLSAVNCWAESPYHLGEKYD